MPANHVSDITTAAFQKDVVDRSMQVPVLLDFWAAWCGPCRTLGPVLEQLAAEHQGGFHLGKVDTEREPELAHAFGVQGIPYCVLVDGGRPVDGFQGALPEAEVRRFLQRNGIEPLVLPEQAEPAQPAPPPDPNSPEARLERALTAVRHGDAEGARSALTGFPEEDERIDRVQRVLDGLEWLQVPSSTRGGPAESLLVDARDHMLRGDHAAAMQLILESVVADKSFRDGLARKAMLLCFALLGEDSESLDDYRRRLATLLY